MSCAGPVEQFSVTVSYQQQTEHYQRIAAAAPDHRVEALRPDEVSWRQRPVHQPGRAAAPAHLWRRRLRRSDGQPARRCVADDRREPDRRRACLPTGRVTAPVAVFLQDEIDVSPRLRLNLGTRYSSFHPHAVVSDPSTGPLLIDSAAAGVDQLRPCAFPSDVGLEIVGGVGQGFRAPNIDDLTILGRTGSRFEVPNPALDAGEQPQSGSGSAWPKSRRDRERHVFPHRYRRPHPTGVQHVRRQGVQRPRRRWCQRAPASRSIFQRQNAGRARIQGVELEGAAAAGGSLDAVRNGGPDGRHRADHRRSAAAHSPDPWQGGPRVVVRADVSGRTVTRCSRHARRASRPAT